MSMLRWYSSRMYHKNVNRIAFTKKNKNRRLEKYKKTKPPSRPKQIKPTRFATVVLGEKSRECIGYIIGRFNFYLYVCPLQTKNNYEREPRSIEFWDIFIWKLYVLKIVTTKWNRSCFWRISIWIRTWNFLSAWNKILNNWKIQTN